MDINDLKDMTNKLNLDGTKMDEIENRLKELKDRTTEFVQKNPLTSIAIAVGVGYIIAKMLRGRDS